MDTVSHEGILEDQGRDPLAFFTARGVPADAVLADAVEIARTVAHDPLRQGPHVVTGPVHVRGARPGDVLSVTVEELVLRADHGVVSNRHGRGALPGEFPRDGQDVVSVLARVETDPRTGTRCGAMPVAEGSAARVRFPLRPFLGLVGVGTPGRSTCTPFPRGCTAGTSTSPSSARGSTLHLPVQVEGALFHTGDPHYAQGDGEVALTAFEAPLRAPAAARPRPEAAVRVRDVLWGETPSSSSPSASTSTSTRPPAAPCAPPSRSSSTSGWTRPTPSRTCPRRRLRRVPGRRPCQRSPRAHPQGRPRRPHETPPAPPLGSLTHPAT